MPVSLTIQGVSYQYPVQDDIDWATNATDWAIAVTDALAIAVEDGDIGSTTEVNIQATATSQNVTNLVFDSGVSRSAVIDYYLYRSNTITEAAEVGTFRLIYKSVAGTWSIEQQSAGDTTNVSFDITTGGQVQYTSTPVNGTGTWTGTMRYRARSIIT